MKFTHTGRCKGTANVVSPSAQWAIKVQW